MGGVNKIDDGELASFFIKINGELIPDNLNVQSLRIENQSGQIPTAYIVVLDGDANTGTFEVSSSSTFLPGVKVSIEAGFDGKNELVFEGLIISQSIRIEGTIGSVLEIECKDIAVKMTIGRTYATYADKTDHDIITTIIEKYAGLTADVEATNISWPQQVQYGVTDWDYLLCLAETNGLLVYVINGKVGVHAADHNSNSIFSATYGDNLISFNAKLDASTQLSKVSSSSWDGQNQKVITEEVTSSNLSSAGNLTSTELSGVIGLSSYQLHTPAPLSAIALSTWASAQLVKIEQSKIVGNAKVLGSTLVEPGKYITFEGVGDRFNGDYLITGVNHDLSQGNWISEVSVGLSPTTSTRSNNESPAIASSPISGVKGLFNGIVKNISDDPDGAYRILVAVPLFDAAGDGIWARLSNLYATQNGGMYFIPEIGDEVILGFINEDLRFPVILGSLHSSQNAPPFTPNENNATKAIISKSGISVVFDDENKVLTLSTPHQNTIVISDEDKKIAIKDERGNTITLSATGIDLTSQGDISISAKRQVTIKGESGVFIESNGSLKMEGAQTEVISAATLILKGALININ